MASIGRDINQYIDLYNAALKKIESISQNNSSERLQQVLLPKALNYTIEDFQDRQKMVSLDIGKYSRDVSEAREIIELVLSIQGGKRRKEYETEYKLLRGNIREEIALANTLKWICKEIY